MASIEAQNLLTSMRGNVNAKGRHFEREIIVKGLSGTNATTYFTTAYSTAGVDIGDAWPDEPSPATDGLMVYCSDYEFKPLTNDRCRIVYKYDSYPFDKQIEYQSIEQVEETIYDYSSGSRALIKCEYPASSGNYVVMKTSRIFHNVRRVIRWSEFASESAIQTYYGYQGYTNAGRTWLCKNVSTVNTDGNLLTGMWLITVEMEYKPDGWSSTTWLEDARGYPIESTITTAYPYPSTTFPTGWLA